MMDIILSGDRDVQTNFYALLAGLEFEICEWNKWMMFSLIVLSLVGLRQIRLLVGSAQIKLVNRGWPTDWSIEQRRPTPEMG